ncbi:hypothetical protein MSG34_19480 [Vibrio sp. 1CM2L]|uniref:hypothetical protein n=1 Tax=Vibrio sp. 1CM2L TaxID=2929166 RepID=UPI0020BF66D4|nr:hypothetical protein [Vibrio sp. 1CM2L]MCK8078345.1 hypothetical protein [Vibrio sp. 1CM2L]
MKKLITLAVIAVAAISLGKVAGNYKGQQMAEQFAADERRDAALAETFNQAQEAAPQAPSIIVPVGSPNRADYCGKKYDHDHPKNDGFGNPIALTQCLNGDRD